MASSRETFLHARLIGFPWPPSSRREDAITHLPRPQLLSCSASALRFRALCAEDEVIAALTALRDPRFPFQDAGFVGAWTRHRGRIAGRDAVLVLGEDDLGPAIGLPLEIARRGPFRIGAFPGETHAPSNGLLRRRDVPITPIDATAIGGAVRRAGLGLDALELKRVAAAEWLGSGFRAVQAAEERFAISLAGGRDAVIERGNAKRKRKKFRAQRRHFEERGGYAFRAVTHAERPAALSVLFAQRGRRFRELQMPNPFSDRGIENFLRALHDDAGTDARLYTIDSGGQSKAMLAGIASGGVFWGMISSFEDDDDASASPGKLLLWHLVEALSAEGFQTLDLGPGDERYKRSWCDVVVTQFDAVAATSPLGRAYLPLARGRHLAVAAVKADPKLRAAAQRLRRFLSGPR